VRQIMIVEGLWKARKTAKPVVHQMRERRACFGELIQIDGSPHAWFEERGPVGDISTLAKRGHFYFGLTLYFS
jgi:hypothetical protein